MEEIRILIVEDDPIIAEDLKRALQKLEFKVLDTLESGEEALAFIHNEVPDIILMDIQLEGDLDGIDTAHQISKLHAIPVIYLTSNSDSRTFNRAKLTQPYGFLSKPYRISDVNASILLSFQSSENEPEAEVLNEKSTETTQIKDAVFFKSKDHLVKVKLSDILYVEADSCYSTIVTKKSRHVVVSTLKKFEAKIDVPFLLRIHRSHIVNINAVDRVGEGCIYIGEKEFIVSRSYKENLMHHIPKF